MSAYESLKNLGVLPTDNVILSYNDTSEVMYNGDYMDQALGDTGMLDRLTSAILETPLYNNNHILNTMREEGYLDEYERGDNNFYNFVRETIEVYYPEHCWIDEELITFDHKRGQVNLSFSFEVPLSLLENNEFHFNGWKLEATKDGVNYSVDV